MNTSAQTYFRIRVRRRAAGTRTPGSMSPAAALSSKDTSAAPGTIAPPN